MNNRLVMTLLVRDEINIIKENILFHLNKGVDFIVATDNGSTDGTRDLLLEFQKDGILHLIDEPEQNYSQSKWVTRMAHLAKEKYCADWVMHNDADEFWYPKSGNIKDELQKEQFNVLSCKRFNMLPDYNIVSEPNFQFHKAVNKVSHPYSNFDKNNIEEHPFFTYKVQNKVITSSVGLQSVSQGNHDVEIKNKTVKNSDNLEIYHYPLRTYAEFELKIKNGGSSYANNTVLSKEVGWHWRYWYGIYESGKLKQEYEKLVIVDKQSLVNNNTIEIDSTINNEFQNKFQLFIDEEPTQIYDNDFYSMHFPWYKEYELITHQLENNIGFNSVIDFGCGNGYFIAALKEKGKNVSGVEASKHAIANAHESIKNDIKIRDLRLPVYLGRYDLVICTEVAEHLEKEYADNLVDNLVRHSKEYIFFTGATPDQTGGINHVNLQTHQYWIDKFETKGFTYQDIVTENIINEIKPQIKKIVWFSKNVLIFKKTVKESNYSVKTLSNKIVLMTNFRTMIPESINTINYINDVFKSLGFRFILLSSSNSDKLNCTVIEIPFSLKDWGQIDLYNSNDILFNEDLITIDAEFNDDSEPKYDEYKKGVSAVNYFVHNIIRKMRPCLTLLWSSTVPQSILFKSIFESYFVPTFFIERGLLPETMMLDIGGYGPFSSMQMQMEYENTTRTDIYEKVKGYYLSKKIEKHKQNISTTTVSVKQQFDAIDKKLIIFVGQWDVAAGVNSTNNIQTYINSPIFASTAMMFEALQEEISKQQNTILIFKPHPFDKNTYKEDRPNGIFIEKKINIHSLFESADVIVGSSTTAINEALLYEKPVILMGHCMLSGKGSCYEVQSLQGLRKILDDAIQSKDLKEKIVNVKKYINYISYNYLLSINIDNPLPNSFHTRMKKFTSQYHLNNLNNVSVDYLSDLVKEQNSLLLSDASDTIPEKLDKAESLIAENELDLAEDILKELLSITPNNIDVLNDISVVYVLKSKYMDAKNAINKTLVLDPNNEVALDNLEYLQHVESEIPTTVPHTALINP